MELCQLITEEKQLPIRHHGQAKKEKKPKTKKPSKNIG